jgi:ElaB/YqjD/DUF883 family membrane-anchored ribosome-binding protein
VCRDSTLRTKNGLKELASNVAKALAKKADRSDLRKLSTGISSGVGQPAGREETFSGSVYNSQSQQGYGVDSALTAMLQSHGHGAGAGGSGGQQGGSAAHQVLASDLQSIRKELSSVVSSHQDSRVELTQLRRELTDEIEALRERLSQQQQQSKKRGGNTSSPTTPTSSTGNGTSRRSSGAVSSSNLVGGGVGSNFTEWRMALGDLSLNVRREMSEKCSREEMHAAIGAELGTLEKRLMVSGKEDDDEEFSAM